MTPEEKRKLEELYTFMQNMSRFERIPLPVAQALTRKLGIRNVPQISVSAKGANSEDISVNEAGASTHTVLADPTGFVQLTDLAGNTYEIPYF